MNRHVFIGAAVAAILAPVMAHAQATTSGAQSQSNNEAIAVTEGGGGGLSGGTLHESGSLYGTALVYAPPIATGNVCALGVSSGVAVKDIGVALGGTYKDADCRDLQKVSALYTMAIGTHNPVLATAALALACRYWPDVADAIFAASGDACPGTQNDRRYAAARGVLTVNGVLGRAPTIVEPAGAPIAVGASSPVSATQVAAVWQARMGGGS